MRNRFGYTKEQLVIYHIFIDRFSRGHAKDATWEPCTEPVFYGGNLRGIIDRLDYLEELGVNALWLSPFTKTSAYHGYSVTDFITVEPRFGTEEDLKTLIARAHQKKMLVIMDFVPNHVSREHPFFLAAQQNKASAYYKWFFFENWPNTYKCFLHIDELPKLNLDYEPAADHVINAAQHWLDLGIDGFRLDHVIGPSMAFWERFSIAVRANYPHAFLIGEAWMGGLGVDWRDLNTINVPGKYIAWLGAHTGYDPTEHAMRQYTAVFDGVMDFTGNRLLREEYAAGKKDLASVEKEIITHLASFPKQYALPAFLDNHDIDRFLFVAGNDRRKLTAAAEVQFALPQPAIIYYGTEASMTQTQSLAASTWNGDLVAREPMNWTKRDDELFAFYKGLIAEKRARRF